MQSFYINQDVYNSELDNDYDYDYDYDYDSWVDYQDWLEQSWD
jgi:hypothetical protein